MFSVSSNEHCNPRTRLPSSTSDVSHGGFPLGSDHSMADEPNSQHTVQGRWGGLIHAYFFRFIVSFDALISLLASSIIVCFVLISYAE